MKQRNLAFAIGIVSCLIFVAFVFYLTYALSRVEQITDTTRGLYVYQQRTTVFTYPELYYASLGIGVPAFLVSIGLGAALLASSTDAQLPASTRKLIIATGVLAVIASLLASLPTIIVAFITFARLQKFYKSNNSSPPTSDLAMPAE